MANNFPIQTPDGNYRYFAYASGSGQQPGLYDGYEILSSSEEPNRDYHLAVATDKSKNFAGGHGGLTWFVGPNEQTPNNGNEEVNSTENGTYFIIASIDPTRRDGSVYADSPYTPDGPPEYPPRFLNSGLRFTGSKQAGTGIEFRRRVARAFGVLHDTPEQAVTWVEDMGYWTNFDAETIDYYTVTFIAKDDVTNDPIEDVNINIVGIGNYNTDISGSVSVSLENYTYNYSTTKVGYADMSSMFTVAGSDKTVEINLSELEEPTYLVTFVVRDETDSSPIQGATINLVHGTSPLTTDENGEAQVALEDGEHSFNVNAEGYELYIGTSFIVDGGNKIVYVDMTPQDDLNSVIFTVQDALTEKAIGDATLEINGNILPTNSDGKVIIQLPDGMHTYNATAPEYEDNINNTFEVDGTSKQILVEMMPLETEFTITFNVFEDDVAKVSAPIEGAVVNIMDVEHGTLITDSSGVVELTLTKQSDPINTDYSVEKSGYETKIGIIETYNEDITETVRLKPILENIYNITFNVDDSQTNDPIEDAFIYFDVFDPIQTDVSGSAVLEVPDGFTETIRYSAQASGYNSFSNTLALEGVDDIVNISLDPSVGQVTVTFTVYEQSDPDEVIQDAHITMNGVTETTNENGVASFDVDTDNKYFYNIGKSGYNSVNGSVNVGNHDIDINIYLQSDAAPYNDLTFRVFNSNNQKLEGALVTLQKGYHIYEPQETNVNGIAYFPDLIDGTYNYSVTKDGYEGVIDQTVDMDGEDRLVSVTLAPTGSPLTRVNFEIKEQPFATGDPIEGVTCSMGNGSTTTDIFGLAFLDGIPYPATHGIHLSHPNYVDQNVLAYIDDSPYYFTAGMEEEIAEQTYDTTFQVFEVEPGTFVSPSPLEDATVQYYNGKPNWWYPGRSKITDVNGFATFEDIWHGTRTYRVYKDESGSDQFYYESTWGDIDVGDGINEIPGPDEQDPNIEYVYLYRTYYTGDLTIRIHESNNFEVGVNSVPLRIVGVTHSNEEYDLTTDLGDASAEYDGNGYAYKYNLKFGQWLLKIYAVGDDPDNPQQPIALLPFTIDNIAMMTIHHPAISE